MSTTTWTMDDLKTLEQAIASGNAEVRYADKSVRYKTLDEMLRIRDLMRAELGLTKGQNTRILSEFDRGTR